MGTRPAGTVTLLFSDIEQSTRLLHELGADAYKDALDAQRRLLRNVFARHDGFEVDTQGDAFFIAFHRAQDAVRAAGEAQRALSEHSWPDGRELRVRIGIHTCEATSTREGYVGVGVHRGARICAAGHGGQVLLSHTTHDLLEEEDADVGMLDLGEHRLRDLTQPQRLFQLVGPELPSRFPPLRTLENRPTNLPIQPTPLVGREREVGEVCDLLRRDGVRLVTLTGPGGTGKTRLALQAAAEQLEEFPNGVFLVALAPITDPELVVPAVAQALGVNEAAGQELSAYLTTKKLLLVVDNVEQVLAAAPELAQLLATAPGLKLLATSREPLHVAAEHVYAVPPLELPDPRHLPEPSTLSQYESVALFVERAQAVEARFEVTTQNAPTVAEICVRLDGLPLALELAAARISLLSPEAMLARLGERLKLLTSGARDMPARQQTLRGTLSWSYDLLDDGERRLFARLAVFAGGFTLEAAEAVCDAELDALASLVDKSLVRRENGRFTMLETVREYAVEQFVASGEEQTIRLRHADYFETLAEEAYVERFAREGEHAEKLERDHDNLRTALDWLGETDPDRRLRLTGALGWFWHLHSHFAEGRARLTKALVGTSARDEVRARALTGSGELAAWAGDLAVARPLIGEAVSIWRELGREQEAAFALHELGWGCFFASDDAAARGYMEESLRLQQQAGDPFLINRAQIGLLQVLVSIGELDTVQRMSEEALELSQQLGDLRSEHFALHFLADCALIPGECEQAEGRYRRSLELAMELRDRAEAAFEIQGLAMAAAGTSRPRRALRLAGAAKAQLDALGIELTGIHFWTALQERYLGQAREELGAEAASAAWEEGLQLEFERAIEEALAVEAAG
jgi:predicted ATPase/class 3 adenylate cyclase